jgi:hypothetical protein
MQVLCQSRPLFVVLTFDLTLITTQQTPPPPKVLFQYFQCSPNCSQSVSNRLTLFLSRYFLYPEDGSDTFIRNIGL